MSAPITLPTASEIQVADIPATLVALAALQSALAARLLVEGTGNGAREQEDQMLDVPEVARRLGKSADWVYHNHRKLAFMLHVGGSLRGSARGLQRYLDGRQRRR